MPGAIVVLAVAPRGSLLDLGPAYYLQKLVSWVPDAARSLDEPVAVTLERLSARTGRPISELTVAVQERPRNARFAPEAAAAGARVELFADGDVERAFRALLPGGDIDLLLGIGGAPEGVITAAAARMLGGTMLARFAPQSAAEAERLAAVGLATDRTYERDELCAADAFVVVELGHGDRPGGGRPTRAGLGCWRRAHVDARASTEPRCLWADGIRVLRHFDGSVVLRAEKARRT